jgi:hypothetical protein
VSRTRIPLLVIVVSTLFVVPGCAAPEPRPSAPTADAAPSPTPPAPSQTPEPMALVLRATSMESVDAAGEVIDSVDFSGTGEEAIAFIEDIAGAPPELSRREADGGCSTGASQAAWGSGFRLTYDIATPTPTGLQLIVDADVSSLPNGVRIQTPTGFAVGDLVSDLEASLPGVHTDVYGEGPVYRIVHYDVGFGVPLPPDVLRDDPTQYWGALASGAEGEIIATLAAPRTYIDTC